MAGPFQVGDIINFGRLAWEVYQLGWAEDLSASMYPWISTRSCLCFASHKAVWLYRPFMGHDKTIAYAFPPSPLPHNPNDPAIVVDRVLKTPQQDSTMSSAGMCEVLRRVSIS